MLVEQDHVPSPLLQMQGGADANDTSPQHQNIGLQFRHAALQKVENNARLMSALMVKLIIAVWQRK
ncbi:MAG TPA: hypothetical protein VMU69_27085, partial [Bradyrhizobium sp.]|nr:hypothetical protein [Bradyrhizobium sp.]